MTRLTLSSVAACLLLCFLSACSPSLSPLYRDYTLAGEGGEARKTVAADSRIQDALESSGWKPVDSVAPNAVTTEERTLRNWGLYRVVVELEVVPLGPEHVRVYFHPYRRYLFGGRGKIPYLTRSLQRSLLPDLNEALEEEGLHVIGTPVKRDQDTVSG